jgi:RND family efflux transporter MFP subunit
MGKDLSALRIDPSSRKRNGRGRLIYYLAALAVLAVIVIIAARSLTGRPVEVRTAVAASTSGASSAVLNASGYVTPQRRATISSKITGKISKVLIEEGMEVEKGQVLATLDDSDARAALEAAKAESEVSLSNIDKLEVELSLAKKTLARAQELRARDLNSQAEVDNAETAAASLEAGIEVARRSAEASSRNVDIARRNLDNCTIRAPFAGVVVSKDAQPGEIVSPISAGGGFTRTGIATIVDMTSLEIEVDVNESYISRVSKGQLVEAVLDAYPDWRIPARVLTVIPTADRQKATVQVRIAFDKLDPRILPDMGVKVSFLSGDPGSEERGVTVPAAAVTEDGGQKIVYVIKDSRAERRAVSTASSGSGGIIVTAGLRQGDKVAVSGIDSLRDGSKVKEIE